jgi:hypothetical protein
MKDLGRNEGGKDLFGFENPKRSFMILHSFQDPSCVLL